MIKKYTHIIWDWNGTLLNDVNICVKIINGMLSKRELKILSHSDYKDIFTFPIKDYYVKVGMDFEKYPFENLGIEWIELYEKYRPEAQLYKEAAEILSYIKESGIKQSVLSAYPQHTLIEIIELFGLTSYFTEIMGLDNIYAHSKVELGKELIQKLGLKKSEVVLIGDTIHDYEVATEIGVDCILISDGYQSKARLLTCGVPVIDSLIELKQL